MAKIPEHDLSDLPDSPDVPKGRHRAKLVKATKKLSRESRLPMIEWEWRIISGKAKRMVMLTWTMLTEDARALAGLKQHMLALGRKKRSGGNTDDLLGGIVTLIVGPRTWRDANGDKRKGTSVIGLLGPDAPLDVDDEEGGEELTAEEEGEVTKDEDEEPEEKPAKKKKPVEGDEEEPESEPKPKKKKPVEDDDDDVPVRKAKKPAKADDDDEPPAKAKKKKQTEEDDDLPF